MTGRLRTYLATVGTAATWGVEASKRIFPPDRDDVIGVAAALSAPAVQNPGGLAPSTCASHHGREVKEAK
jgi:hypothetical protein